MAQIDVIIFSKTLITWRVFHENQNIPATPVHIIPIHKGETFLVNNSVCGAAIQNVFDRVTVSCNNSLLFNMLSANPFDYKW